MNIGNKLKLMLGRAVVKLINDSAKIQEVQIETLSDEARGKAERYQNYGFTSFPKKDAEAIVVYIGGDRSHPVVIACDDRRYRKKDLLEGECAMYTHLGDYIYIKNGRIIEMKAATEVKIDAPLATVTGNLKVNGNISCDGSVSDVKGSMQKMRDTYNVHTNPSNGASPPPGQMT